MGAKKLWSKIGVAVVIVIGAIGYLFSPKPIIRDLEHTKIYVVLARNKFEGDGHYKQIGNLNEAAILEVLCESKQRQTLYNYDTYFQNPVCIDLVIALEENGRLWEVNLGNESFVFGEGGSFKRWVLDQEKVMQDIVALIEPQELRGTVLEPGKSA